MSLCAFQNVMRIYLATVFATCYATTLVDSAPPPLSELEKLGQTAQQLQPEHWVSTELSLRQPGQVVLRQDQAASGVSSRVNQGTQQQPPYVQLDILQHGPSSSSFWPTQHRIPAYSGVGSTHAGTSSSTTQHGALMPSSLGGASSSRAAHVAPVEPVVRAAAPSRIIAVTPGLDPSLTITLRDPIHGALTLPFSIKYVPSLWFDAYFNDARRRPAANRWRHAARMELSEGDLLNIVHNRHSLLRDGRHMYKIVVPTTVSDWVQPGEVLLRYHWQIILPESQKTVTYSFSVWCPTEGGRQLAFLGLYRAPQVFKNKLLREARAEDFQILTNERGRHLRPITDAESNQGV